MRVSSGPTAAMAGRRFKATRKINAAQIPVDLRFETFNSCFISFLRSVPSFRLRFRLSPPAFTACRICETERFLRQTGTLH